MKYKEIFSTTENKLNLHNTSPLEIYSEEPDCDVVKVKSLLKEEFFDKTRTSEFLSKEIADLYLEYTESQNTNTAKVIREKLKKEIKFLNIKFFILMILFIITLILDVLIRTKPAFLDNIYANVSIIYLISSFSIFLFSCILGFKTIKSAFFHIIYAVFAPDTAIIFPLITTFLNCMVSFLLSLTSASFKANIFVSLFIFNFMLLILNSLTSKKRILKNFKFVISSKQKYNVDMYFFNDLISSTNLKKKLCTTYQYKTNFLTDFIQNSYKQTLTESIISKIIPFSIAFSVICGILNFIFTKNYMSALTALNISSLISFPFAVPFVANSIVYSTCKYILKNRAMAVGENAIRKLSGTQSIVLNDYDLYPKNNVTLRGIKTFNGQRIDEAILLAAAVGCYINAPISQVFDRIILGKKTILAKASDVVYNEGKGVVGWVSGKKILLGNRELLKEHKIGVPSRDYEKKYRIPNCELTYFAIGRELVAMFILEYTPSKSLADTLIACIKNNIKIFVKTVDSNLTIDKIASDFNLDEKFVNLISYDDSQKINSLYSKSENCSNAFFATLGSCASLIKSINACFSAKSNIILVMAIQFLQIILNIFLALYLIFFANISELHTLELTLYSLLWFIFTVVASKFKYEGVLLCL